MFNHTQGVSFLVLSAWKSKNLLYVDDFLLSQYFCYYFIEHIFYAFSLHLFSLFYAHDS
jgi:hypothetical protein